MAFYLRSVLIAAVYLIGLPVAVVGIAVAIGSLVLRDAFFNELGA